MCSGPAPEHRAAPPAGAVPGGPHVPGKAQSDRPAGAVAAAAGAGAVTAPGEAGAGTAAPADPGEQEAWEGQAVATLGLLRYRGAQLSSRSCF